LIGANFVRNFAVLFMYEKIGSMKLSGGKKLNDTYIQPLDMSVTDDGRTDGQTNRIAVAYTALKIG